MRIAFLALLLVLSTRLPAQRVAPEEQAMSFPEAWVGVWSGNLVVQRGLDTVQQLPMTLSVHPTSRADVYTWSIQYGADSADVRPYSLVPVDAASGKWQIDEHNSIVLDAQLHGRVLYSRFDVMGNLLLTRDELRGDTLHHEIISGSTSKGLVVTGDSIAVTSYPIGIRQWSALTRRRTEN